MPSALYVLDFHIAQENMTAHIARKVDTAQTENSYEQLELPSFSKKKGTNDAMHLNLRLVGEDAQIYKYLERHTETITDSLRLRDNIRVVAYLVSLKLRGEKVLVPGDDGEKVDLLDYIGAFFPQGPMDKKRRTRGTTRVSA